MAVKGEPATPPTSPTDKRGRRDAGYALIELVMALAILGLLASVVLPRAVRAPGAIELRATAEEIAALLRSDRNAAISERREVVSEVDLDEGIVASASLMRAIRIPPGVHIEFVQSSRMVGGGRDGGFGFLPNGRSSGGALTIQRGDTAYRISVNWLTGSVLVTSPET
jgi:general secretion pathway protein H